MTTTSGMDECRMAHGAGSVKDVQSNPGFRLLQRRASGVLLHPTSLPGPGGTGDMGSWCLRFLDFLVAAKAGLWQVLPLGPTGFGGSPYQCTSSCAGNPLLISVEWFRQQGLIDDETFHRLSLPETPVARFTEAAKARSQALEGAFLRFGDHALHAGFDEFVREQAWWLNDYALYAALKEDFGGDPWFSWPDALIRRESAAMEEARMRLARRVDYHRFVQYIWSEQWHAVRAEAHARGILIMGDIPIFPAHDSADVWANQAIFKLDERGMPDFVAGVPPDYFSETGQLWGNPVYRWDVIEEGGFEWWTKRVGHTVTMVDIVRLDHFRGFMAAWEVPAGEKTAIRGAWVKGPGRRIFEHLSRVVGPLPIVAEDLGVITPDVEATRIEFGFPGMKILVFAFDGDAGNPHLPHHHAKDAVVYTGTHDNDTVVGWCSGAGEGVRRYLQDYLDRRDPRIPYDLIRLAYASAANTAIVPMQDVLGLGGDARMNYPGREEGNWGWRMRPEQMDERRATPLADLARIFGRLPEPL